MNLLKSSLTYLLTLLLVLSTASVIAAGIHEDHPYEFDIRTDPYAFATYFQIDSINTYIGTVKKSSFELRTNYDLSDENGWQATGIKNVFNLGTLYAWASEITVYDARNVKIAMIDGQVTTTENAKFSLYEYDEEGDYTLIGVAYLDNDFDSFTILDTELQPIAKLERYSVSIEGAVDYWHVSVSHPEKIDDRLFRIFAAFVIDNQDYFHEPDLMPEDEGYEDEMF
jgi:hypothetical protein